MRLFNYPIALLLFGILYSQTVIANTDKTWRFKVYLSDQQIGEHTFYLSKKIDQTHIAVTADFNVRFLFINAYSYEHSNYEIWNNGCLTSIKSVTNDNGDELFVNGTQSDTDLTIETNIGTSKETGCIKSFAYWDHSFLNSHRLLNAQTGEIMDVRNEYIGTEKIDIRNAQVQANHYRLHTDKFTIDLWYSTNNEWLALNSTTSDGSMLRYVIQ